MKFDFDNQGWAAKIGKVNILITPIFRLADDDYDRIIVASVYSEKEAIKIADNLRKSLDKSSK